MDKSVKYHKKLSERGKKNCKELSKGEKIQKAWKEVEETYNKRKALERKE